MADEEERRPLRHLKFREFENVSGDLSADEIRRLYANKMTELRDNARGNSQALENLKKDKEEEKKELDEQKTDLGKDPRTFYIKMKERYDSEMSALAAEYPDQSDPEYSRRADLIKARFAHVLDKELLDTNQNAYVNTVMDAVERSEAKISNDLRVAETKTNAENNKLAASAKMLNDQQKLLEANPDLYARLYNIKQRSATHDDPRKDPQTMIAADKKGQPCLAVIMADARFPAGFIVSDGKINFSQDNIDKMTVEMMRQIIDYLDRRGIHGIELPDGIDEKLAAAYNEADGANREAEDAARINEQETPEAEEAPIRPLPENDGREEIPASGYTNQDARDFADEFGGGTLRDVSVDSAGNVALLLASGQVCQLVTLDKELNVQYSGNVTTSNKVVRRGELVYLLTDSTVESLTSAGEYQWSQGLTARPQALLADAKQALVFCGNTVQQGTAPETSQAS